MRRRLLSSDNKYARGVVAVAAGSARFPGAALLAVGGARHGNAGYVKFVGADQHLVDLVISRFPDVAPIKSLESERIDALVAGPGGAAIPRLEKGVPIVLDSQAISAVVKRRIQRDHLVVVTPHEGELRHLGIAAKSLDADARRATAIDVAKNYGVIVVLKGNKTVIAAPSGEWRIDEVGGPELACAGSGDLLAGLIGSFLVTVKDGASAFDLVCDAIQVHSEAGRSAASQFKSVTAVEIMESLALV